MIPADSPIELQDVVKRYRDRMVLKGLDLRVPRGAVAGLLGKNGEGKTTLIKCALGIARADLGTARVFGRPAWDLDSAAKSRLGYVPQVPGLYPWMRVGQMTAYTASFYERWNDALVRDLLSDWELSERDKIGTLSVGSLQKLAIVLAMGHEPELLVLDEPAASLDPSARRDFLARILDIASAGGRTVLFSTHITSDLERVADRVAILRGGKIVYDGELDELKESVKRLHVRSARQLSGNFNVPGAMRVRVEGNEALVSVQGRPDDVVEEIRRAYDADVRVEDLNLEDIFLEMHP
jgi:ABC-2 type transport system ATP-binding protein